MTTSFWTSTLQLTVHLALLLLGYWILDCLLAREHLSRWLKLLLIRSVQLTSFALLGLGLALYPVWTWSTAPLELRALTAFIGAFLAWNAATRDLCPVENSPKWEARLLLPLAAVGAYFSPAFALLSLSLLSLVFHFWSHHASFPMRALMALVSYACWVPLSNLHPTLLWATPSAGSLIILLIVMQASHYLIAGLGKARLGERWYSWMFDNHLHLLATSAYSWGWSRFLPFGFVRPIVLCLQRVERPLQVAAFSLELFAPLALLDFRVALAFSLSFCLFHGGVFLISGLLFWDWVLTNLALAATIYALPSTHVSFGGGALLVGSLLLVLFPLRHKLWRPMPLAWFDSPLTSRLRWEAEGQSGKIYEIYNNFMCPYERLYGRVHGYFLSPKPLLTYHLGEVFRPEIQKALLGAGPDSDAIDKLRDRFGISPPQDPFTERHTLFLQAFFATINGGFRKRVLPRALGWLKAPGDQIYYFGELPAFEGQEPVCVVHLRFVEDYFDGTDLKRLSDQVVLCVPIPKIPPLGALPEPSPQLLDTTLLTHANGRLILLPPNFSLLEAG